MDETRFWHLHAELCRLWAELRFSGASFEDLQRARQMVDNVKAETIGAVIHDFQAQLEELQRRNLEDGIEEDFAVQLALEDAQDGYEYVLTKRNPK